MSAALGDVQQHITKAVKGVIMSSLPNRRDELEEFKQRDLVAYARSYGYQPVKGEVSRTEE